MKNRLILISLAAIVVILGLAYVFNASGGNGGNSSQADNVSNGNTPSLDNVLPNTNSSFRGELTTVDESGKTTKAVIRYDGKGSWSYESEVDSGLAKFVISGGKFYTYNQDSGKWLEFPAGSSVSASFNVDNYKYDENDVKAFRQAAHYVGEQSCAAGTCYVWNADGYGGNDTFTMKIDKKTGRISEVNGSSSGMTTKIVYYFEPTTVEVPKNAEKLDVPNL